MKVLSILACALAISLQSLAMASAQSVDDLPEITFVLKPTVEAAKPLPAMPVILAKEGGSVVKVSPQNTVSLPLSPVEPVDKDDFFQLAAVRGKDVRLTGIGVVRMIPLVEDYLFVIPTTQAREAVAVFAKIEHVVFAGKKSVYYVCTKKHLASKPTAATAKSKEEGI